MVRLARFFLLFCSCFSQALSAAEVQYELGVCAIFNYEAEYLPEWIEFHKKQGVEKFWLYFNGEEDEVANNLEAYISSGDVDLIQWRGSHDSIGEFNSIQLNAYMHCITQIKRNCKWCAFIDVDEFLYSPTGLKLIDVLEEYEPYSAVVANWVMYGTSNVDRIPSGESILDKLVFRAPMDFIGNKHFKSIVKPQLVEAFLNPHQCVYKHGFDVSETHERITSYETACVSVEKLRINHYWTRDEHFFETVKVPRRTKWGDEDSTIRGRKALLNQVFDDSILNYR